ncbi:MAG: outer membrane lipoprotein-sorting protein [Bdellovibrionota bacterium]
MRNVTAAGFSFLVCLLISTPFAFAKDELALKLLKSADKARGNEKLGLTWTCRLSTTEDGEKSEREFLIKAQGDNSYVEATQPSRTKGEVYIFNDRSMWFFKPSLKRPVSISPRQKLSGQAANGDIASTRYSRDYDATIEKAEVYDGEKTHVLMLKAKSNNLTYDRIRYWISDSKQLAVKAEFLTLQGQVFKTATIAYDNSIKIGSSVQPFVSRMTITDARNGKNQSIMEYIKPRRESHPSSIFNVGNLSR